MFQLADELRHRPHRADYTPRARTKEHHKNHADQNRRQHEAVKPEGELCDPRRHDPVRIRPLPGQLECPEQHDHFG